MTPSGRASLEGAKAEMEFALMAHSVLQGACLRPDRLIAPAMQQGFSGLGSSFLRGWRSMPGITPPTSQLDWLISKTAITATCVDSRAYRISHLARRSPSALRYLLRQASPFFGKSFAKPNGFGIAPRS